MLPQTVNALIGDRAKAWPPCDAVFDATKRCANAALRLATHAAAICQRWVKSVHLRGSWCSAVVQVIHRCSAVAFEDAL